MSVKFSEAKGRDELGARLIALAERMLRSFDQGADGRISVDEETIHDIKAAAACVLLADIVSPERMRK
jgi:hypothetical protein